MSGGHGSSSHSDVIPGESPFVYCSNNTIEDLLQIEYVAVTPNPPKIGDIWTFEMGGKFTRDIPEHSMVNITGRINGTEEGLPGLEVVVDFCNLADSVEQNDGDLICPPKKGRAVIRRQEYIPWGYPAQTYNFIVDAKTPDGERMFCLHTEVFLEK